MTREQEARIITQYHYFIRNAVWRFIQRCGGWVNMGDQFDDLYQEAAIAFLTHVRGLEWQGIELTTGNIVRCQLRMFNAMYKYRSGMSLPVAIHKDVYKSYVADLKGCIVPELPDIAVGGGYDEVEVGADIDRIIARSRRHTGDIQSLERDSNHYYSIIRGRKYHRQLHGLGENCVIILRVLTIRL